MAEPIAALIVRILADTAEMVTGVKQVTGQLDTLENRVMKFGKALVGYFSVQAIAGFANQILAEVDAIDTGAKRIGAGVVEYQQFQYALKQTSGDAIDAAQNIASLNERIGSNDNGLLGVLRKLNINFDEFRAKDPIQRYVELGIAISGVADPAERTALRVEALGAKGEKALAGIDAAFKDVSANAPVYSEETVAALDRVGNMFDDLWQAIKVGSAEAIVALADVGKAADELAKKRQRQGAQNKSEGFLSSTDVLPELADPMNPGLPVSPSRGNQLPALIGPGGVDPADAQAMAVALADLALKYEVSKASAADAKEQWDAGIGVLRALKMEITNLTGAMGPFLDAFGTTTKVENLTQRILDLATKSAQLREEQERLLGVLNPGSVKPAGDGVEAEILKLRGDSRNWMNGNLTPQALQLEADLLNTANLRLAVNSMPTPNLKPVANSSGFSSVVNRVPSVSNLGSVMNPAPAQVTINAQGSYWRDPQMMNELGRLVEDAIAGRGTGAYSRR